MHLWGAHDCAEVHPAPAAYRRVSKSRRKIIKIVTAGKNKRSSSERGSCSEGFALLNLNLEDLMILPIPGF